MKIGVIATALKPDERRVPIHPRHLERLPAPLRRQLVFERGYGEPFGFSDATLAEAAGGLDTRAALLAESDAVILLKPTPADLGALRRGGVLWGWPHCVQQRALTQVAIERELTLVAFEKMFEGGPQGELGVHTFYKNNELAGYCAVLHALALRGLDGHYGRPRRGVVLGFGAVARGAIRALQGLGFRDLTVCVQECEQLGMADPACQYVRTRRDARDPARMVQVGPDGAEAPLLELLASADVVVNAILQDPERPVTFVREAELSGLVPGCLLLDVSCDEAMGFDFARATSFAAPMRAVGHCFYYAVDHTPSYLWDSASWEISDALLRHLPAFAGGREAWAGSPTLVRAIEVDGGRVLNPVILSFQGRAAAYPHD